MGECLVVAAPARRGATREAFLRIVTHAGEKSTIDCGTQRRDTL